jgi:hypothetical protein
MTVVVDEKGGSHKVNIWSDFPDFANINVGSVLRGKIEPNGQYENIVSETQAKRPTGAGGAYKEKVIGEAMQRKETSIGKFQDSKEFSIKVASTMSGAVALACAEYKDKTVLDTLDKAVLKWREFLWENWDKDVKDNPPF